MLETNQVKTEWNKIYYVYNDEILALIGLWKEAPAKKKPFLQGRIIDRMGYIISKRISFYKSSDMYEDLMQEARIGIIIAMERFDPTRSINFFHFSIWHVQNKIRIYLKKQKRRRPEILVENMPEHTNVDIDPATSLEEKEAKKVLLSAINELPEMDRKVIQMRFGLDDEYNEGRTYQQIGDVFSVSRQRIEQINSSAVSKLRKNTKLKDFFNDMG